MADQAELAFIKSFVSILAPHPLVYPDDYQQPPENTLKRLPVIPVRT
jgi:ubiquitin-like protein 4